MRRLFPRLPAVLGLVLMASALPAMAQTSADAAPAVSVATAQVRPLMQVVPLSGSLVARNEVLVFPHSGGFAITALNADLGDRVEAGAVLARIDDRTLSLRLRQAEAQHASATAALGQARSQGQSAAAQLDQTNLVLERLRTLRASGTATQSALDEAQAAQRGAAAAVQSARDGVEAAEAALQQSQATLEVAQLDLRNAAITAPVSGIVSARNGQIGAIAATAGEPVFRLIEDGVVEVSAEVIETELVLLSPGDPAQVRIAGQPPLPGAVRRVAPVVSAATRLGEVRVALDDSTGLRPGLYVGGQIVVADREGLAVPLAAVLRDSDGAYVLRLTAGAVLERRPVETGLAWDGWVEVTAGLEAGDEVVARAGAFFAAGDTVRPIRAAAEAGQ